MVKSFLGPFCLQNVCVWVFLFSWVWPRFFPGEVVISSSKRLELDLKLFILRESRSHQSEN